MVVTGSFGLLVIAINVYFVVGELSGLSLHWAIILLIVVLAVAYFLFVLYLVSKPSLLYQ